MKLLLTLSMPNYSFNSNSNPYKFDATPLASLETVAIPINELLSQNFADRDILLRAVQSSKHKDLTREQFIEFITSNGLDYEMTSGESFYAAAFSPWNHDSSVLATLEGFHKWKPKSEEVPQQPLDIWMVFDADQFELAPYTHHLHNTKAEDKYRLMNGHVQSDALLAIIIVN